MIRPDEGYIKFNLDWNQEEFTFDDNLFKQVNFYRKKLFDLNLIGIYADEGIGFGNISNRLYNNQFIISGSATGEFTDLKKEHYAVVTEFDISKNKVSCKGLTKASSESMSHAAIYSSNLKINAVVHVHHQQMWNKYLNVLPTTDNNAAFGTPEIAYEIQRLAKNESGIIIMGGHPEGIISYAETVEKAYNIIIKYYNEL